TEGTQFRSIAVDLEQLLARAGVQRQSRPLPVRNSAAIPIAIIAIAVVAALLTVIVILGPKDQKGVDIKGLTDEIVNGFAARIRRAQQLLLGLLATVFGTIANAVSRLNDLAHQITQETKTCGDQFAEFEKQTTKLVFALSFPDKRFPQPLVRGPLPDMLE